MSHSSKWDGRFFDLALEVAGWSKDPSTKVGSVLVDTSRRIVGTGYNGFPRGVNDDQIRYLEKAVKYRMIVHAEANALLNAVASATDATLYATKFPCTECTKLIIQRGVYRVVAPKPDLDGKWGEDAQFSTQMLREAVVRVDYWDNDLGSWVR